VHDAAMMDVVHGPGQRLGHRGRLVGGQGPDGHRLRQAATLDELHGQVGEMALLADLGDGDDVGMLLAGRRLGLDAGGRRGRSPSTSPEPPIVFGYHSFRLSPPAGDRPESVR
jgi:hypothetical protein